MSQQEVFEQVVAPAVLIPACGLLLMSSTARLNTVLARIRSFHKERLDIWQADPAPGSAAHAVRKLRLEGLEHQSHRLLSRAALLRLTMVQLLLAIACNLCAALGLVAFLASGPPEPRGVLGLLPSVAFAIGILLLLGATATSLLEVLKILETVRYEHDRVETLCASKAPALPATVGPEPSQGEGAGI